MFYQGIVYVSVCVLLHICGPLPHNRWSLKRSKSTLGSGSIPYLKKENVICSGHITYLIRTLFFLDVWVYEVLG
jgi:hypothetical protein